MFKTALFVAATVICVAWALPIKKYETNDNYYVHALSQEIPISTNITLELPFNNTLVNNPTIPMNTTKEYKEKNHAVTHILVLEVVAFSVWLVFVVYMIIYRVYGACPPNIPCTSWLCCYLNPHPFY